MSPLLLASTEFTAKPPLPIVTSPGVPGPVSNPFKVRGLLLVASINAVPVPVGLPRNNWGKLALFIQEKTPPPSVLLIPNELGSSGVRSLNQPISKVVAVPASVGSIIIRSSLNVFLPPKVWSVIETIPSTVSVATLIVNAPISVIGLPAASDNVM